MGKSSIKKRCAVAVLALVCCLQAHGASAESMPSVKAPRVVVTLAPLHSLTAGIMEGVAKPELLLKGNDSPHHFTLRPRDARSVTTADMVVFSSLESEYYLKPILSAMPKRHRMLVEAISIPGMTLLSAVPGEEIMTSRTETDMHVWLDPANAIAFTEYMEESLSELDPPHADIYEANASRQVKKLETLFKHIESQFGGVHAENKAMYASYHSALQYFENRFHISGGHAVTRTPESGASVAEARALENAAAGGKLKCLFQEPQFSPKILQKTTEKHPNVQLVALDHLGGGLEYGPNLYEKLMHNLAAAILPCLKTNVVTKEKLP